MQHQPNQPQFQAIEASPINEEKRSNSPFVENVAKKLKQRERPFSANVHSRTRIENITEEKRDSVSPQNRSMNKID